MLYGICSCSSSTIKRTYAFVYLPARTYDTTIRLGKIKNNSSINSSSNSSSKCQQACTAAQQQQQYSVRTRHIGSAAATGPMVGDKGVDTARGGVVPAGSHPGRGVPPLVVPHPAVQRVATARDTRRVRVPAVVHPRGRPGPPRHRRSRRRRCR